MKRQYTQSSYRRLWSIVKSPSMVMFAISLIVLIVEVAYTGKIRPFDSDDLYWQQIVRTWHPFSGHTVYLGTNDTFVGEVPPLAILEHFFSPSRKLLIAEASLFTAISFTGFYWSSIYFLRKLEVNTSYFTLLPFVWLASFGYPLVENYLNIDWRTFEVGFAFLTFMTFAALLHKEIDVFGSLRAKVLTALAVVIEGVLVYSDPYYLFFALGPILLFLFLLYLIKRVDRRLFVTIASLVFASIAAGKAIGIACKLAGLTVTGITPSAFVNIEYLVNNVLVSLHGLLMVFGADLSNVPTASKHAVVVLPNLFLLGFIVYKLFALRGLAQRPTILRLKLSQLWLVFFGSVILLVFLVYTTSTLVTIYNYRYFLFLIYAAILFLSAVIGLSQNRALKFIIGCALISATISNIGLLLFTNSVSTQSNVQGNVGNSVNYAIVEAIESKGLTKGYANYWQANVNTYFAAGKATFLPSLCTPDGNVTTYHWLIDGSRFGIRAQRTFFLYDPDIKDPATCTMPQIIKQFGKPVTKLYISDKTILVYNYDISFRLHHELHPY